MSFSLLLLATSAFAGTFTDLRARLDNVQDPQKVVQIVKEASGDGRLSRDPDIRDALENADVAESKLEWQHVAQQLKHLIAARAMSEFVPTVSTATAAAKQIKASGFYHDPGVQRESNWLSKALERLKNLKPNFNLPQTRSEAPSLFGGWMVSVVWVLLGVAVCFLVYLAAKHFRWKLRLTRKATALLEDDEPERTVDEWLERADLMAQEGKHREAVRCLYLACLLRFDEARVASFDRGQTNWEHLARIRASPRLPAGLDFTPPTQAFDRIWYGRIVRGMEDVQQFRDWYEGIVLTLKEKAA